MVLLMMKVCKDATERSVQRTERQAYQQSAEHPSGETEDRARQEAVR
jgi:hypothetical protein